MAHAGVKIAPPEGMKIRPDTMFLIALWITSSGMPYTVSCACHGLFVCLI